MRIRRTLGAASCLLLIAHAGGLHGVRGEDSASVHGGEPIERAVLFRVLRSDDSP